MNVIREIPQGQLTSECWWIQFRGKEACLDCEIVGTPDCGGKKIRKKGVNSKGFQVPLGKEVEE